LHRAASSTYDYRLRKAVNRPRTSTGELECLGAGWSLTEKGAEGMRIIDALG